MPSRFKSLELQGYKTFATRTDFHFAERITAIVGPNGSGKSNIADAIRWVLGEQTYSLLRGKKTEDMIFSGSEHRPRAGMASATIIFDNAEGWLPIDFAEVAITRRAYRDGENEYLINGQRVRLKDVTELLAQSGLAERTYTVIGQGLVDAALSLKAEERRRLFEEAAGIGLHRSRREEALRRLDNTQRNLERVEDILAELQPRLRSLERQARRAQEYEQVKADLQVLLRDWYGYHWHRAQNELAAAREAARRQEKALAKARQAQYDLDEKTNTVRSQIRLVRDRLSSWHGALAELHTKQEAISRILAVGEERQKSLAEQRQSITLEINRLQSEIELSEERLENEKLELDRRLDEYQEAVSQLEAAQQELDRRQSVYRQAERALIEARQGLAEYSAMAELLNRREKEGAARLEKWAAEREQYSASLQQAIALFKQKEALLQEVERKLSQAKERLLASRNALVEHHAKIVDLDEKRQSVIDQSATLQNRLARLKAQIEVIEQAEKDLEGYASGSKLLLQTAFRSTSKLRLSALSSHIEVPVEYEKAIGAALGDFLDGVLFPDYQDAETTFEMLDQETSRGVLLPVKEISSGEIRKADLPRMPGILGWAADLVRVPDELSRFIRRLMWGIVVVENRTVAKKLLKLDSFKDNPGLRVVTLSGDVFYQEGPMIIGPTTPPSLLSRSNQLRKMKAEFADLENVLEQKEKLLEGLHRDLEALSLRETDLRREVKANEEAERAAIDEQNHVTLAISKARQEMDWQQQQYTRLENDIAQGNQEISEIRANLETLLEKINAQKQLIKERSEHLAGLALDDLQDQVAHWNTKKAVQELAVDEARRRLAERETGLTQFKYLKEEMSRRLSQIEFNQEQLKQELQQALRDDQDLSGKVAELNALIKPAEEELLRLEQEQAALLSQESEVRQAVAQAEQLHAQMRVAFVRRQESLENLRSRIEDDFGLVDFRYYDEGVSGPTPLPLDGMVEKLPVVRSIPPDLEENVKNQRALLRRIGPVNVDAQQEYQQVKERFSFLKEQVHDLQKAEEDLKQVILELDTLMEREFRKTFDAVAHEFRQVFTQLFGGGSAQLLLTSPDEISQTGIDIEARLPGRREQGLSLLSGGERSLTAAALVFALLKVSPTPFCVLDEVDAMLDEVNVGRYRDLLRELSSKTQFIVITHNRSTVQAADVIYGVTMGHDSTSQVISLRLDEVNDLVS